MAAPAMAAALRAGSATAAAMRSSSIAAAHSSRILPAGRRPLAMTVSRHASRGYSATTNPRVAFTVPDPPPDGPPPASPTRSAASISDSPTLDEVPRSELDVLNWTSARLYRLLLREIRAAFSRGDGGGDDDCKPETDRWGRERIRTYGLKELGAYVGDEGGGEGGGEGNEDMAQLILLQPPVNNREYGAWRVLKPYSDDLPEWRPSSNAHLEVNEDDVERNSRLITEFFLRWSDTGVPDEVGAGGRFEHSDNMVAGLITRHLGTKYEHLLPDRGGNEIDLISDLDLDSDSDSDSGDEIGDYEGVEFPEVTQRTNLLVSSPDLIRAVRDSFLRIPASTSTTPDDSDHSEWASMLTKKDVISLHRCAIDALRLLSVQREMWHRTSVTVDEEKGIRIVAVSDWTNFTSTSPHNPEHCFSYRIRVENLDIDSGPGGTGKGRVYQLMGRQWFTTEHGRVEEEDDEQAPVDGRKTGVLGQHPVIRPGEAVEYMSGVRTSMPTGLFRGIFHMAEVDGESTPWGVVGDEPEALFWPVDDPRKFTVRVGPIGLVAEGGEDTLGQR